MMMVGASVPVVESLVCGVAGEASAEPIVLDHVFVVVMKWSRTLEIFRAEMMYGTTDPEP